MELWIRSQDRKRLTKVEDIYMIEDEKNFTSYIGNNIVGHLGEYKKVGRALEVLDEIQNILKPKYILDTSSIKPDGDFYEENGLILQKCNANARIEKLSTFVYQMPDE